MIRPTIPQRCAHCGNGFQANRSAVQAGRGRFCSSLCYHASTCKRISYTCENCDKAFEAPPSQGKRRFCSHQCSGEYFRVPLDERFNKYVGQTTKQGCVLWVGALDENGYGVIWSGPPRNTRLRVSRVVYEREISVVPEDLDVLHRCDNPPCINGEHLFLGTQGDNNRDRTAKGRTAKGEDNGFAKLSELEAIEIKMAVVRTHVARTALQEKHGVTRGTITNIWSGKTWKHLNIPQSE